MLINSGIACRPRERGFPTVDMTCLERIAERIVERMTKTLECLLDWKPEHGEVEKAPR